MDVDILIKLIVAIGLTGCAVGISIQLMKLLSAVTSNVKDFKKVVKNVGEITDNLIEEQDLLEEGVTTFVDIGKKAQRTVDKVSDEIIDPLVQSLSFIKRIVGYTKVIKEKITKPKSK